MESTSFDSPMLFRSLFPKPELKEGKEKRVFKVFCAVLFFLILNCRTWSFLVSLGKEIPDLTGTHLVTLDWTLKMPPSRRSSLTPVPQLRLSAGWSQV